MFVAEIVTKIEQRAHVIERVTIQKISPMLSRQRIAKATDTKLPGGVVTEDGRGNQRVDSEDSIRRITTTACIRSSAARPHAPVALLDPFHRMIDVSFECIYTSDSPHVLEGTSPLLHKLRR